MGTYAGWSSHAPQTLKLQRGAAALVAPAAILLSPQILCTDANSS